MVQLLEDDASHRRRPSLVSAAPEVRSREQLKVDYVLADL